MYDFVGGKQAWLAAGLPTEGTGVHLALAGEVLVPVPATCDLDSTSLEIRAAIGDDADAACVVTNAHGVVLGRIRAEDLPDAEGRLLGMLHRHDAERALTERRHPL